MTKPCRAGLSDGTITTPKDALLAMGSKILLSSNQSVGSTRLPVWAVILEEHRRQFELLGDRSGASMPMKPAPGSPDDMKVTTGVFTVTVTRMLTVRLVSAAPRGHRIQREAARCNSRHRELPVAACGGCQPTKEPHQGESRSELGRHGDAICGRQRSRG